MSDELTELLAEAGADDNGIGNVDLDNGDGDLGTEPTEPADEVPAPYLRDLSEDDVYSRLQNIHNMPSQLTGMESRFNGGLGDLTNRISTMEKATPTQANFDFEGLTKGLEAYDPKLAEVLVPLLQDAFKVQALDENTLRPYMDSMRTEMQDWSGEQIVMSAYSPETLAEIIPPVQDGKFMAEGQRHKDFTGWYAQQGYQTQQALLTFGAPYVNALCSFERWEQNQNSARVSKSKQKTDQLVKGQVPTSQHRKTPGAKRISDDEAFESGFNEAFKEVGK